MSFNFALLRREVRQTVHDTLAVPALYQDDTMSAPLEIAARWTVKGNGLTGDLDRGGYAQIQEGIDTVIFNRADARAIGVKRGGYVIFPDYDNVTFVLAQPEEYKGPVNEVWTVGRQ